MEIIKKKHFQKVTHPTQGVTGKANGCININTKYPHKFILKCRLTDTAQYFCLVPSACFKIKPRDQYKSRQLHSWEAANTIRMIPKNYSSRHWESSQVTEIVNHGYGIVVWDASVVVSRKEKEKKKETLIGI